MSATQHLKEISPSLRLLPALWFPNTWSWGYDNGPMGDVPGRPRLWRIMDTGALVQVEHPAAGTYYLWAEHANELLFTENESNNARLFGTPNRAPFVKDAFHHYVVNGAGEAVNPAQEGTKCAAHYALDIMAGETMTVRLRLARTRHKRPFN